MYAHYYDDFIMITLTITLTVNYYTRNITSWQAEFDSWHVLHDPSVVLCHCVCYTSVANIDDLIHGK